ncbi:hypothetical protein [Salinibacterium sp. M195]|uniref:hypothetical protein n=1 Tax=Salinibacterium sp. M195 TaxID=2583374 RepID=UPI001C631AA1|nr:hypothetical protein [Salinibacterium sp. M195]QYH34723.1 hypothetical protein FFT87_01500 [Salinibacterium sp. M195]
MNRKVLRWVVVLLASLTVAAAAAVWLIVAGTAPELVLISGLPPLPTLVLGMAALMVVISSLALIRADMPPRRSHTRSTYIAH